MKKTTFNDGHDIGVSKKVNLFLLLFILLFSGQYLSAQVSAYTKTNLTGLTYTQITGGTQINTVAGLSTGLSNDQDDGAVLVTLPFAFSYNGSTFTQATFCTNGWVGLGDQMAITSAQSRAAGNLFTATAPINTLAAWFGDLGANFPTGNGSMVHGSAGTDVYAFEWRNAVADGFTQNTNNVINFKVVLYGPASATPGRIEFLYGSLTGTALTGRSIGIENATGGPFNYLNALNGESNNTATATAWPGNGTGYRFDPPLPCSGTPNGGTVNTASQILCSGSTPSALTVAGATVPLPGITYQWEQSTDNGTTWVNAVGGTGATTLSYSPPVFAGAAIQYRLKVTCTNGNATATSTIASVIPQSAPTTQSSVLTVGNSGYTSFALSFTVGNGGRRQVLVSTSPITNPVSGNAIPAYTAATAYAGTGQQIVFDGTSTSVTVTGLTCGTTYYVKVFEYNRCGSGPYDVYFNTATGTNALTINTPLTAPLPVINAFTGFTGANLGVVFPGWFEASITTASGATPTMANPAGLTSSWTNSAVFPSVTTAKVNLTGGTKNEWIISPKVAITAASRVRLRAAITDAASAAADAAGMQGTDDKVNVMVTSDCGATWTSLYTFQASNTTALTNALTNFAFDIPASFIGQTIQIGFQATEGPTDDTPSYDFHISNINIEATPSCDKPILTATTNITKNSATINWLVPAAGIPTGYEYVVSTSSTAPTGAGTATTALTANVSPLTPDTTYYVYVRTSCGSDFSVWTNPGTFKTLCNYGDITAVTPGTRCGAGTVNLSATANSGTLKWFANATGGAAVGTGSPFAANVTETTTFYVTSENIGSPTPGGARLAPAGTSGTTAFNYGLVFDATSAFTLNSVDVFLNTTTAGDLVVALTDNTGAQLQTATIAVPAGNATTPVQFTVPLAWNILPGTGYRLLAVSGPGMLRESSLGGFPYAIGGSGSVTNGYISGNSTTYYYFYNWNFTGVCAGPRTAVTATVNTPPAFTLGANPAAICVGQSTTPVMIATGASDYNTYVWTPSAGVSGNATTGWTFNPTATTTYTLQASQSAGAMCNAAPVSVVVSVNPLPTAIVLADATVCETGNAVALTPTGGTTAATIFTENFNAATNGWTAVNNSTGGTPANAAWTLRPDNFSSTRSNDNTQFYRSDSDAQGSGSTVDTALSSPVFSTVGFQSANIQFFHYFYEPNEGDSTGKVEASLDGTTWVTLQTYDVTQGAATAFANANVALTTSFLNQPAVYIRFKFDGEWRWYWNIDNVSVSGQKSSNITWSPATGLYTDAAATIAYTANSPAGTVYAKPTTATTYTLTVTSASLCSITDTVDVTITSTPAPAVPAATQEFCNAGTVGDLIATGTGIKWYASATGGVALTATTALVNGTTYYASQTLNGCESSVRVSRTAVINIVAAPAVADDTQEFCNAGTVAELLPNDASIKWYSVATGGTALASTDALASGSYYASQTVNGCEGLTRTLVTVTINVTAAPAVEATQIFCNAGTIADLVATGTAIKWYSDATGGAALASTDALVDGTTYYASQTIGTCEGIVRSAVIVTVNVTAAPTVDAESQIFCNSGTVADLTATGTGIIWYDAETGGNALDAATALVNGTTYYASQTIDGCESVVRAAKEAVVNIIAAPTADTEQEFCDMATVADLSADGTDVLWYADEAATVALTGDTALVDGTMYYASQSIDGCESLTRTAVTAVIHTVVADAPEDVSVCEEYVLPALTNGSYFTEQGGQGTEVAAGTVVTETTTLYVYAQEGTDIVCSDENMFIVTVANIAAPEGEATQTVSVTNADDATVADLIATGVEGGTITWYASEEDALAGVNALSADAVLASGATYYAVQTVGDCSSAASLAVTVDVVLGRDGFDMNAFTYHPNPVRDILNITYSSEITSVTVFNLLGQQVITQQPNANQVKVDMSGLADAAYIVNVTAGNAVKTIKVIKRQ